MMLKPYSRLGLLLVLGASLSACSGDPKWKEEVQLSDGRVIVIERELLTESGGDEWALNRSGSKPKEYRIRFEYPVDSGKIVEWRTAKKSPNKYPEKPLILDLENNKPVIFSSVATAGGCQVYSKYLLNGGAWNEEKLPAQFEKRATNLLIFDSRNRQTFFDLEAKRKNNSEVTLQDFKQVGPKHPYCR